MEHFVPIAYELEAAAGANTARGLSEVGMPRFATPGALLPP